MLGRSWFALVLLAMPVLAHTQGGELGTLATAVLVVSGVMLLLISVILTTVRRLYQKTKASEGFVRTGLGGVRVIRDGGALVIPKQAEAQRLAADAEAEAIRSAQCGAERLNALGAAACQASGA